MDLVISEDHLQGKLNLARSGCAGDAAKAAVAELKLGGVVEIRAIEYVEELDPELKLCPLTDGILFEQR